MIAATPQRYDRSALRNLEMAETVLLSQCRGLDEAGKPIANELRDLERAFAEALPDHFRRGEPLEFVVKLSEAVLIAKGIHPALVTQAIKARDDYVALQEQLKATQAKAGRASLLANRCRAWVGGTAA